MEEKPTIEAPPSMARAATVQDIEEQLAAIHLQNQLTRQVTISLVKKDRKLVEQPWFNLLIGSMVTLSVINMGLEVDLELKSYSKAMDHVFATIWTIEFLLKICCLGPCKYFSSAMNILDFFLAWCSIIDSWMLPMLTGTTSGIGNLTPLRLLRLVRLIRLHKLLRSLNELWLLVIGLINAIRVLVWVILLLVLLIYVGAIFLTYTIGHECDKPDYQDFEDCFTMYGTLLRSMLTLFEVVTDGGWQAIRPVIEKKPWVIILVVAFVYLTTFGLMNIVAGVIFEQVLDSNAQNNEELAEKQMADQKRELELVRKLLKCADGASDGDGKVSPAEWMNICEVEAVKQIMEDIGLSVSRKRLAQRLYDVVDPECTQDIELDTMLERIFQLKTEGRLQNKDMSLLLMDVRHTVFRLERMEEKFLSMEKKITGFQERFNKKDEERFNKKACAEDHVLAEISKINQKLNIIFQGMQGSQMGPQLNETMLSLNRQWDSLDNKKSTMCQASQVSDVEAKRELLTDLDEGMLSFVIDRQQESFDTKCVPAEFERGEMGHARGPDSDVSSSSDSFQVTLV
eukprot:gnl/MRDRNA2_/MRDRNA2_62740_c0_seq2.p1 gnl/MRDRNA2_/MRDRNA2_62740_c0~~gnl/MRDRNA2_/MRDRNA2_62740_c0_seq2.p1  ORF type:complete len:598 (+),score=113.07 gnl/MRDRNA2_/MRDRNA2_62740_c0_seq2:88-1794(+)